MFGFRVSAFLRVSAFGFRICATVSLSRGDSTPRPRGWLFPARVPNILCLAEVNHFFGYILGVVPNALQALGDDHHVQAARDGVRVCDHLDRKSTRLNSSH